MPNHFEFNADSFDELLTGEDNSVSSPEMIVQLPQILSEEKIFLVTQVMIQIQ